MSHFIRGCGWGLTPRIEGLLHFIFILHSMPPDENRTGILIEARLRDDHQDQGMDMGWGGGL
jgi:hypothetical protein